MGRRRDDAENKRMVHVAGDDAAAQSVALEDVSKALTLPRQEILDVVRESGEPLSITEISRRVDRQYSRVYLDVEILVKAGFLVSAPERREGLGQALILTAPARVTITL